MKPFIQLEKVLYKNILFIESLKINESEIIGIMGPNGAGKSTLLKLLSLLDIPTEGTYIYNGTEISPKHITVEQRRKFSIALQQSLLLNMTVFQNVAIGLKLRKLPKKVVEEKVQYWLEKFHIAHLAKKHAYHLSGGEAQRVNLARALIVEPEVLFLDEPFSALDFPTKIKLLKDLKEILETTKTTTIFVSHDLMEIKHMTEKLLILMNGEIKQFGNTLEVVQSPNQTTAPFLQEWTSYLNV